MKDKLYKNHSSGFKFKLKRFMGVFVLALGLGSALAIPTYILLTNDEVQNQKAEEEPEVPGEGEEDPEDSKDYLMYNE